MRTLIATPDPEEPARIATPLASLTTTTTAVRESPAPGTTNTHSASQSVVVIWADPEDER